MANINTLIYTLINPRFLQRIPSRLREGLILLGLPRVASQTCPSLIQGSKIA
jgi:hypothetical protein